VRAVLLDVFTDRALTGNQLAVFVDGPSVPVDLRQDIAREIGFSETVFVDPPPHPTSGDARVRIFTPEVELGFAGHPVLGTAVALAADRDLPAGSVVTLVCTPGPVPVEIDADRTGGWMRQPLPTWEPWPAPDPLVEALGVGVADLAAPVELYDNGVQHIVVAVDDPDLVRRAMPDHSRLGHIAGNAGTSLCALTGPGTGTTRMFMPGGGIVEDAATGSAAGPIGIHLLRHGHLDPGGLLTLEQGTQINRPSSLHVRVEGLPDAIAGVGVGGKAIIVGELTFRL
jgi:trans-2,3-dihydro-3-hydroxyanthranilate isomerase